MARRVWVPENPLTEKESAVRMNLMPPPPRAPGALIPPPPPQGMAPPPRSFPVGMQPPPMPMSPPTSHASMPPTPMPMPTPSYPSTAHPPAALGGAAGGYAPLDVGQAQQKELEMWKQWKQSKKSEDLRPIVQSMQPLIQDSVNTWRGRVRFVPDEAIEAEFKNHAIQAIRTYDPSKGAQLGTWVRHNLRKGGRFVKTYQNVGRVVEQRTDVIGDYNQTKAELGETMNRAPTEQEMLTALKTKRPDYNWSKNELKRMESELRADILSSAFESDMNVYTPSLDKEIAAHLHEELSEDEKKVWNLIHGPNATQGKTGLMAKELGWSDPKVSRMRKSIEAKAKDLQRRLR